MEVHAESAIQKLLSGAFIALAILLLPLYLFVPMYIVLGQGHFILAYVYQLKAHRPHFFSAVLFLAFSSGIFFWIWKGASLWELILTTGAVFIIHMIVDQLRLCRAAFTWGMLPLAIFPFLVYFSLLSRSLHSWFRADVAGVACLLLGAATVVFVVYRRKSFKQGAHFVAWFSIVAGFLGSFLFFAKPLPLSIIFGGLILFHYIEWYVFYFQKLKTNIPKRRTYIRDALIINGLVILAYIIFLKWGSSLQVVFNQRYFYGWALLHTLSSFFVQAKRSFFA